MAGVDFQTARRAAALAATETGRGSASLAAPVLDDLGVAATLLAAEQQRHIGIITGFYIPRADEPAAETDGPLGAAILAATFAELGFNTDVVTDAPCLPVLQAALNEVSNELVCVEAWSEVDTSLWTNVISIERVGRTLDGTYRNMLGADISAFTAPLDVWYESLAIPKIGIGDGGNEIGMGRLSRYLVAAVVEHGADIGCIVGCDHLIVGGTSNWGAFALAAVTSAMANISPAVLEEEASQQILSAIVRAGGVDGVTARRAMTVDNLAWDAYWNIPQRIYDLLFHIEPSATLR